MFVINETLRVNVTQLGECWPCLQEALGSDPSTAATGWSVLSYDSSAWQVGRGGSKIQGHCGSRDKNGPHSPMDLND